jgi:hypothetical protein
MKTLTIFRVVCITFFVIILNACGGGSGSSSYPAPVTMSGSVSGLKSGSFVVELNNANPITFSSNGAYSHSILNTNTDSFDVAVVSQPVGQICTISSGDATGVVDSLTNVQITCAPQTFHIFVSVSGLVDFGGTQLELIDNNGDSLSFDQGTESAFSSAIDYNGSYSVSVKQQPSGQICTITNGTGTGVVTDVNISVICSTTVFTVSGSVTGLTGGQQFILLNNSDDPDVITANGNFTFTTPVALKGSYNIIVYPQPIGQTCTVSNGSGDSLGMNVSNVLVTCSVNTYTVSGTVSGLTSGQVTLMNNGADPLTVSINGLFTFAVSIAYDSSYVVTINQQPVGQTCVVTNGAGSGIISNVSNISVAC